MIDYVAHGVEAAVWRTQLSRNLASVAMVIELLCVWWWPSTASVRWIWKIAFQVVILVRIPEQVWKSSAIYTRDDDEAFIPSRRWSIHPMAWHGTFWAASNCSQVAQVGEIQWNFHLSITSRRRGRWGHCRFLCALDDLYAYRRSVWAHYFV